MVLANPNYVKKVIFPLEILAGVIVGGAFFNALTSLIVLAIFELVGFRHIPLTALWLPLVWLPLLTGCLALTWLLGALGVFLRDVGQIVAVMVSMLMFLSPIFFPLSALPARWQPILVMNPLAPVIEQTRRVLVDGSQPSLSYLIMATILTTIICEASFRSFQKAKRAFADVL
jgi:lipopolysaccharide transport system permease protein